MITNDTSETTPLLLHSQPDSTPKITDESDIFPEDLTTTFPAESIQSSAITTTAKPFHCIVPLFLHMLGVSLLIAPTQTMIISLVCNNLGLNLPYAQCAADHSVQTQSATWLMALSLCLNIPGVIAIPIIGLISDQFGRKRAFLLPIFGAAIQYILTLTVLLGYAPLSLLLVANILHGFMGGFLVIEAICFSYIADTSEPSISSPATTPEMPEIPSTRSSSLSRSELFGQLEALLFLSFTLGPFLGGTLVKLSNSYVLPFAVSLSFTILELLWILFILPESRILKPTDPAHKSSARQLFYNMRNVLSSTVSVLSGNTRSSHLLVCSIILLMSFSMGSVYFLNLYTSLKWGWTAYDIGKYILVIALTRSIYMGLILPILLRVGKNHYKSDAKGQVGYHINLMRLALLIWAVGHVSGSLVYYSWQFYLVGFLDGFGAVVLPIARGLVSVSTSSELQGQLFATIAVMQQFGSIFAPLLFGVVYKASLEVFPGSIFLLSGGLCLVGFGVTFGIDRRKIAGLDEE